MTAIVDRLREALDVTDGRTIEEMIADDPVTEYVVEKAEREGERTTVWFDGALCTSLQGPEVKVGDTIGLYDGGVGMWGRRHGWALNGTVIEWRTPLERIAERVRWLAEHDREQRDEFAKSRAKLDADYEALPAPLKARIARFRGENPAFRVKDEAYEMFCCTEAAKFARRAGAAVRMGVNVAEVDRFWSLPVGLGDGEREPETVFAVRPETAEARWLVWAWALGSRTFGYDHERQKAALDAADDHSGNTFGGAMGLALRLLAGESV